MGAERGFRPLLGISYRPTAKTGFGYTGKVLITNLEANAPNGDHATFTVDFTGVGELKKVTAA